MAGGQSQRFGSNKALARLPKAQSQGHRVEGGQARIGNSDSIIGRIANILKDIFEDTLVLTKDKTSLSFLEKPWLHVLQDRFDNFHPLNGLASALSYTKTDKIFVCGCDMPFIDSKLIRLICSKCQPADAVVPVWQGEIQPLLGVYSTTCLATINDLGLFNDPRKGFRYLLSKVNTKTVDEKELGADKGTGLAFFDIDTPEQLQHAFGLVEVGDAH